MNKDTFGPILAVRGLTVDFGNGIRAVDSIDFEVQPGEIVALVGESGSGKSVTSMSILGLLPKNANRTGSISFEGTELTTLSQRELRSVRGQGISMIFQDPVAALNPVLSIGFQLGEAVRHHNANLTRAEVTARTVELLATVEIPDPVRRLGHYPHQLSGGQCQRVVIAMALAGEPRLLIADEPTTALDVTVQAEVLEVLRRLHDKLGMTILMITHDMAVVADIADRVIIMKTGKIVESNDAPRLFSHPEAAYTRQLLSAVPRFGEKEDEAPGPRGIPVLQIRDLVVNYGSRLHPFRAVDGVSLDVHAGEIVALVGESGSGKTTVGRCALGLAHASSGTITVGGIQLDGHLRRAELTQMRKRVGVIFQNPAASVDPRKTVGEIVGEPLRALEGLKGVELRNRVNRLLHSVDLPDWIDRYPHEVSGGQLQRVAIARAIALDPQLLIADEPTSALDVSVQAKVLDLFRELQLRLGFGCLFISHNLAVVDTLCDRVAVMSKGRLVEEGTRHQVLRTPTDPYTRHLIDSCPVPDPVLQRERREVALAGRP
jgi:peptide/nickel transport system ATP-binding protein